MNRSLYGMAVAIFLGFSLMTFGAITLSSQGQGVGTLTPDQVDKINGQHIGYVITSTKTIPELLATTTGDLHVTGGHLMGLGSGSYPGYPPSQLIEKTCRAGLVVLGRAGSGTSHLTPQQYFLYTDWGFSVEQVFKDNAKAPVQAGTSIVVVRPGGVLKIGNRTVYAIEQNFRDFHPGEEYLLFLEFIPETGAYRVAAEDGFAFEGTKTARFTIGSHYPELEVMSKDQLLKSTRDALTANNCNSEAKKP